VRLPGLSAVVPARDEAADIGGVVAALLAVLPAVASRYEVIVVDDGSTDGTAAAVPAHATVRVIRHARSRGYGGALRSGLEAAREPWVFFTDGDGQFDLRELPRLVDGASGADIVAGYRVARADPLGRRICGRLWTALVGLVLGVRVRDVNCAFKLLRCEVLGAVRLEAAGALINAELLGRAVRRGFRVHEMAVSHRPRLHGRASGGKPGVAWTAVRELTALARRIRAAAPPQVVPVVARTSGLAMAGPSGGGLGRYSRVLPSDH
jgi:glycosyltransferase involved in cell wall biosynthesis